MCHVVYENEQKKPPTKINEKLSYRLEYRASASYLRFIIMLLWGIWLFEFSYILHVGFLANVHGNGLMRVYKNSIHSSLLDALFLKNLLMYPHTEYTGIN